MAAFSETIAHLPLVGNDDVFVFEALLLKLDDSELHHGRRPDNDGFCSGRVLQRQVSDIFRDQTDISGVTFWRPIYGE